MRRDVVNVLTRFRRDLRFVLADRYRALLGSRFVLLNAFAAAVLDRGLSFVAAARAIRSGARPHPAMPLMPAMPPMPASLVRAAVTGGDELSLTLRDVPARSVDVVLRRGAVTHPLPTTSDRGELVRLVATLPAEVCDGEDWTVAITGPDSPRDITVLDPAALAARLTPPRRRAARGAATEPHTTDWPPRLRADDGRLVLRAASPAIVGINPTVEVGVRSAIVSWPTTGQAAALLLVSGDTEQTITARVEAGTAHASIDLRAFDADATWFAFTAERVPLVLPRATFPPMDDTGRPHRVPLPTRGATGRAVEVGYSPDNQLVVRVGNFAPAAS